VNDVLENAVAEMRAIVLFERGDSECESLANGCRTDAASLKLKTVLSAFGEDLPDFHR
jgi:guanylate kinase